MIDIHLIWAQDENGGIGKNGQLPWHISEDLKNFKKITSNSTIIMGRKTWDSLPIKPLPNRENIVLSKSSHLNVQTYKSYKECLHELHIKNINKIFIIGGRSIYKLFYNDAKFLHVTNINFIDKDINEFFPIPSHQIEKKFKKISDKILCDDATYTYWESK